MIRQAIPDDAPAIAAIHVETWRTAYAGLIPASELAALSIERRTAFWRTALADHPDSVVVCSHDDRLVTGFVSFGASRDADSVNAGEIYAIYVAPSFWGQGCGHRLLTYAVDSLRKRGYREAILWVLEGNERALRFYAAHGFVADRAVKEEFLRDVILREYRYRLPL
jgi:ribosomal protein S18 acetylase RimI-like enzyme